MKKFIDKLREHSKYEEIEETLQIIVYNSLIEDEFDNEWTQMISAYDLIGNDWLEGLHKESQCCVPPYVKHSCWAGMFVT